MLAELLREAVQIARIGPEGVAHDLVAVAATAARPLAEFSPFRRADGTIKRPPDRRQDRLGTLALGLVERLRVMRGRAVRHPEIGRAIACEPLGGGNASGVREKIVA